MPKSYKVGDTTYQFPDDMGEDAVHDVLVSQGVIKPPEGQHPGVTMGVPGMEKLGGTPPAYPKLPTLGHAAEHPRDKALAEMTPEQESAFMSDQPLTKIGEGLRLVAGGNGAKGRVRGANKIISGTGEAATPLVAPALAVGGLPAAGAMAGGMLAKLGVEAGAKAMGVNPDYAEMAGNVASIPGAVAGGKMGGAIPTSGTLRSPIQIGPPSLPEVGPLTRVGAKVTGNSAWLKGYEAARQLSRLNLRSPIGPPTVEHPTPGWVGNEQPTVQPPPAVEPIRSDLPSGRRVPTPEERITAARTTAPTAKDAPPADLLDDIAKAQTGKSFNKLRPQHQDIVRDIAKRLGRDTEVPVNTQSALANEYKGEMPQRVYHGTSRAFDQFDTSKATNGEHAKLGTFFAEDPELANRFAQVDTGPQRYGLNPNVRVAALDIKHPLDLDTLPKSVQDALTPEKIRAMGYDGATRMEPYTETVNGERVASKKRAWIALDNGQIKSPWKVSDPPPNLEAQLQKSIELAKQRGPKAQSAPLSPENQALSDSLKAQGKKVSATVEETARTKKALDLGRWLQSNGINDPNVLDHVTPDQWQEIAVHAKLKSAPTAATIAKVKELMSIGQ